MAATPLILLVDDDPDFLDINRHVLEPAGFRIVTAENPAQALQQLECKLPALIITDLMMTSLDSGFSLAQRIKSDPRFACIPVIIATAVTSQTGMSFRPQSPAELKAMHADAYFDKPIPPRELLAKVAELLGPSNKPC